MNIIFVFKYYAYLENMLVICSSVCWGSRFATKRVEQGTELGVAFSLLTWEFRSEWTVGGNWLLSKDLDKGGVCLRIKVRERDDITKVKKGRFGIKDQGKK